MSAGREGGAPGWETRPYRRIAVEEAYAPRELLDEYVRMLRDEPVEIGFRSLMGYFLTSTHPQPRSVVDRLADLGEQRIADMDATGIDHQVLSLTSPGTQVLDVARARAFAELANDRITEAVRAHPTRFSGLAAVGFEDAPSAIDELDRAVGRLGLRGLIANSHIKGTYLDDPRYLPILEKTADLGVPVYLHPQTLPDDAIRPYREAGLDGAVWGFAAETGLHLLRMITSGLFDRIPGLRVVVGHLGEGLPYWLHRIDHMHAKQVAAGRYEAIKPLQQRPSEYLRTHVFLTTSGMPWEPAITFARQVVGAERVMYAMDYPYQFVGAEVEQLECLPYPEEERRAFFQTIAEDVFSLRDREDETFGAPLSEEPELRDEAR
ncbi:amidohydrolase family protein [Microbacterium sp. 18062]|uniref:amidohydrolase family protein n=1 Tax=Microbacterium sp. 18062 TaxID=2681410 RepID=UPI00135AB83D|nr:amidohydrolase family protein [Microbacterium sp. 18062]